MSESPPQTCAECNTPLPPGASFCAHCGAGMSTAAPARDVLGQLTTALQDRYRVEREVGRGGMATVFLAHDLRHERDVAIKVLHPELAASLGAERFEREIRVAAKLQHPHILSLYDSGAAGGLLFYVMPFVPGESLRDRLSRDQMLPVDEALNITLEVADALGYAHSLGIVHRDIKPENIMLSGGHALVTDFGIARALSSAGEQQKLTQTGTAIGTPLYMSPEQSMGDEAGPTSDLYSLACVAYEMLTGQPPFTGANARAIMARHTMEAVPSIRLVRDAVPEEVEEALLMALGKVPADRPQTASQFAELLGTPLGTTASRRVSSRPRLTAAARVSGSRKRPVLRRPAVIAAIAAVVLAAAAGGWWALQGRRPAAGDGSGGLDPRRIAVLYFADRSDGGALGYLADGLTEGLMDELASVAGLRVVSRGGVGQFRGTELDPDSVARALGAGLLVLGGVEPVGGDVKVDIRLVDGASGVDLERRSFTRPAADPLAIRDELSRTTGELVRRRLGEEIRLGEQRAGTSNTEAWVLLQQAERLRKQLDATGAAADTAALERGWVRADSLLEAAERLDDRWVEPIVLRGTLAYRRSRIAVDDPIAAERWITVGLGHANRALALARRDPVALELRGTLRYWRWLLQLEREPAAAARLLANAKADLDSATTIRPTLASAWATLSHLNNNLPNASGVAVVLAAQRALEADAFLANADVILQRLFFGAFDLGDFPAARASCEEGLRRFPANPRFTECRLWMLATRTAEPTDVARAWRLVDSLLAQTPPALQDYQQRYARSIAAAVLARAGLVDSARAVLARSRGDAQVDPTRDLANIAAFVYALLGDTAQALDQLGLFLSANPSRRAGLAQDPGWWFRNLAGDARFRAMVGTR